MMPLHTLVGQSSKCTQGKRVGFGYLAHTQGMHTGQHCTCARTGRTYSTSTQGKYIGVETKEKSTKKGHPHACATLHAPWTQGSCVPLHGLTGLALPGVGPWMGSAPCANKGDQAALKMPPKLQLDNLPPRQSAPSSNQPPTQPRDPCMHSTGFGVLRSVLSPSTSLTSPLSPVHMPSTHTQLTHTCPAQARALRAARLQLHSKAAAPGPHKQHIAPVSVEPRAPPAPLLP